MKQKFNVGQHVLSIAEERAEQKAWVSQEFALTYKELGLMIEAFATRLKQNGVRQSSVVVIDTEDKLISLLLFLSTSLLGAQVTFASKTLSASGMIQPSIFVQTAPTSRSRSAPVVTIDDSWSPRDTLQGSNGRDFDGYLSEDHPWFITSTSGTTGTPKFLTLSQKSLFQRSRAYGADFIAGETIIVPLFGARSRPYAARATATVFNGCTIVDSLNPAHWQQQGVNLVTGSPAQVKSILSGTRLKSKIDELQIGGGKVDASVNIELLESFTKVVDLYGASESNRTYKNVREYDEEGRIKTYGVPLDSEVQIMEGSNTLHASGEVGTVRIRNPYLAKGYLNNPNAAARSFRDGWFYPGDRAAWGVNGELIIEDRSDNIINLEGTKINAQVIETILRTVDGIKDAVCFKNPKKEESGILAFVVLKELTLVSDCLEKARTTCETKLAPTLVPKRIARVEAIPLTDSGKVDRKACEKMVMDQVLRRRQAR